MSDRESERWCLLHGDCAQRLLEVPDASVDAIVTDPPSGISFMGKDWDGDRGGRDAWIAWLRDIMIEVLRTLKPGGHALVWALPRTSHWTATALEDAGFEIRDVGVHLFGTGFPKSLDVSKAVDGHVVNGRSDSLALKQVNASRPGEATTRKSSTNGHRGIVGSVSVGTSTKRATPATDAAAQWSGWGTALKPAAEHWILCRKPLIGTVAANVLAHGTGALNIDATRIATGDNPSAARHSGKAPAREAGTWRNDRRSPEAFAAERPGEALGRWPANVTLDEDAAAVLDAQSGKTGAASPVRGTEPSRAVESGTITGVRERVPGVFHADTGGASRFFYVAKAPKREKTVGGTVENTHPTVKSIALMRWLIRLITPSGGLVLDPFTGSGTTGVAALEEHCMFLGIEREQAYLDIAEARIRATELSDPSGTNAP